MVVWTIFLSYCNWTDIEELKFHGSRGWDYPKQPPFGPFFKFFNFFFKISTWTRKLTPLAVDWYQFYDYSTILAKLMAVERLQVLKKKILNTHISKNMGLSAKEFSVGECFPKGYLHTQNERNWRKKIFWWSIFTLISARMPQRFKKKFLRKSVFHDHFYFQDLKIILY